MFIYLALGCAAIAALFVRLRSRAVDQAPVVVWTAEGVRYKCGRCREWHVGLPAWHFPGPDHALEIPPEERAARAVREEDGYLIDGKWFFTVALMELPVQGSSESYVWGVWVNLRRSDVEAYVRLYNDPTRTGGESFEARLSNSLPGYPETRGLPVRLRVRPSPTRPSLEVLPREHPLARQQREGIPREEVRALVSRLLAGAPGSEPSGPAVKTAAA